MSFGLVVGWFCDVFCGWMGGILVWFCVFLMSVRGLGWVRGVGLGFILGFCILGGVGII